MLGNGLIAFDSISFSNQLTDISMARCPDGSGNFVTGWPTFNRLNCGNGVVEFPNQNGLIVYPNPVINQLTVVGNQFKMNTIEIRNIVGQRMDVEIVNRNAEYCQLNTTKLFSGIYIIKATDEKGNQLNAKFIKQ
jgi:hypothetical protein